MSEAMQGYSSNFDAIDVKSPSKRTFYPTSKYAFHSQSEIGSVGNNFVVPDHSMSYAYRYRAQQLSRRFGIKNVNEVEKEGD